jgi:7-cyano-7-deazaguanine synthase in queuosine biosynthesis
MNIQVTIDNQSFAKKLAKTSITCQIDDHLVLTSELNLNVEGLLEKCGRVPTIFEDFLFLSAVIYTIDKMVRRKFSKDNWTRILDVQISLQSADTFNRIKNDLQRLFNFLTGDIWSLEINQLDGSLINYEGTQWYKLSGSSSSVSLFSGGLDSLVGCIDWLEDNPQKKLIVVGHHDPNVPGPLGDQTNLLGQLNTIYPERLIDILIGVGQDPAGKETTFRSRSLLFIALGAYVAKAAQSNTLIIPENGTIALNFPLTPSRRGTCSTRTAHPYYLRMLEEIIRNIDMGIRIINPYSLKTKGEVVLNCRNIQALRILCVHTRSCAKSGHKKTWRNRTANNCGRCMPCIYRRAALNRFEMDIETYGNNICTGEVELDSSKISADDFRACISFLNNEMSDQVIMDILYSNTCLDTNLMDQYVDLVKRTKTEIKEFLRVKARDEIKRRINNL